MLMKTAVTALMGLAMVAEAASIHQFGATSTLDRRQKGGNQAGGGNKGANNNAAANNANNNKGGNNAQAASVTCLAANAVQTGSDQTGQVNGVAADGQVNSATDPANFINLCSGQTLTNGLQNRQGSCNGIPMGKIPAVGKMVSTVILNPQNNDNLNANTDFNITLNVANMELGHFTNATSTYYSAPQDVSGGGQIIGHTHVTVQDTGNSLNPTTPLDATQFVFFKGINDAGNGQGLLTTAVKGGLPKGCYRVCSMSSASNHQPVLMPVAQRGAQDDCRYFSVGGACSSGAGGNNNAGGAANNAGGANNNNNKGGNNANAGGAAANQNGGSKANAGGAAKATATSAAANSAAKATATTANSAAKATSGSQNSGSQANAGGAKAAAGSAIAGIAAPAVQDSGDKTRPFQVNGDTFVNKAAAVQRACAIQNNACADAVNSGKAQGSTVGDCNTQETACNAAGN